MVFEDPVLMLSEAAVRSLSVPLKPVMSFSSKSDEFVLSKFNEVFVPLNLIPENKNAGIKKMAKIKRFFITNLVFFIFKLRQIFLGSWQKINQKSKKHFPIIEKFQK